MGAQQLLKKLETNVKYSLGTPRAQQDLGRSGTWVAEISGIVYF